MSAMNKRAFSIEKKLGLVSANDDQEDIGARRHKEIMDKLHHLSMTGVEGDKTSQTAQPDMGESMSAMSEQMLEKIHSDLSESLKLKEELEQIQEAIMETKREIATLHNNNLTNDEPDGIENELDAIVTQTESATNVILEATEIIDSNVGNLTAALKEESHLNMAGEIQDETVKILEACNFQDITGQRISKVVKTLKFVSERVNVMMEIWGGEEKFEEIMPVQAEKAEGDKALLNGPSLETDTDTVAQDDIDALFN